MLVTADIHPDDLEDWVKCVAETSRQRVDWYFMGGRAVIKACGDLGAVRVAMNSLRIELDRLYQHQAARCGYPPECGSRAYWREVWPS